MTTIPGYYTTEEVQEMFEISRQRVAGLAQREGWKRRLVGNAALYTAPDVLEYRDNRNRTRLVKEAGWWSGRGLYRDRDVDIACPICEAFAVEWPPPPAFPEKYLCLKGHSGKFINSPSIGK